jgi:hypothetical protein
VKRIRARAALPAWLCVGAAAVAGCTGPHQDQPTVQSATFTYTCCTQEDVSQVVHPGGVVLIHWIVAAGPPSQSTSPVPVTLSASLAGSYADPASLKHSVVSHHAPPAAWTATPLQTTDREGGAPVSVIRIPADAAPGWYELDTTVGSAGATMTGGSIIQIQLAAAS